MIQYDLLQYEELPDSDDTPMDNELQILIPTLLSHSIKSSTFLAVVRTSRLVPRVEYGSIL